jgi:hypothetical protein
MLHSIIGEFVRNLKFLKTIELTMPMMTPINTEKKARVMNYFKIKSQVHFPNSLSGPENSNTVLNSIIQTASLVMPSPNTRLNNLGCCS